MRRHIAFVDMVRRQLKEGGGCRREGSGVANGAAADSLEVTRSGSSVKLPADMPVYDATQKL
jgi:hypothetical protein